jgi:hypothetical protein
LSAYVCLFRVGSKFHAQPVIPLHVFWDRQTLEFELLVDLFNILSSIFNLLKKKFETEKKTRLQRTFGCNISRRISFTAQRYRSEFKFVMYSVEFGDFMVNVIATRSLQTAQNFRVLLFNNGLRAVLSHLAT